MIGLNNIIELLKLVVFSGHIKGEKPVSAIVTAEPEAGKTEMVMKFSQNKGLVTLTDCTAYGIMRDYGQSITQGIVKHLVVPDLIKPMSRGSDTVHSLIAFLNALIEEGVISISTYAEKLGIQNQENATQNQIPVKCGLIATMARRALDDGRHQWSKMGFMSRLLPISYSYKTSTKVAIQNSIAERKYLKNEPILLDLPSGNVVVNLPEEEAQKLIPLSSGINSAMAGSEGADKIYGFRIQKQLQGLVMANALMKGRDVVNAGDIDKLASLADCINLSYYPI